VDLAGPPHRVGVLCMGFILHSDTAKERFAVGRHNSRFKNSNATLYSYISIHIITCPDCC